METPNRLLLGDNSRSPTEPLELTRDYKNIVANNSEFFGTWFKGWIINYVLHLVEQPKWFGMERNICVWSIVTMFKDRGGIIREITIIQTQWDTYRNYCGITRIFTPQSVKTISLHRAWKQLICQFILFLFYFFQSFSYPIMSSVIYPLFPLFIRIWIYLLT